MICNDPILITGVYRSGTTIVSRMLDAHPELNVAYDSVNYFRYFIKKATSPSEFRRVVNEISDRLAQRYDIQIDSGRIIQELEVAKGNIGHAHIYDAVMRDYFRHSGKRWGEKTLLEWSNIPVFLSMFPRGKSIHIIRDPRDVMASYKNMTIETGDKYLDSIFACMHSMNAAIRYKASLDPKRYYVLMYESFIVDTASELRKICRFLEVDFSEDMLDSTKYVDSKGVRFSIDTHTSFPDEKDRPIGRWKEKLSEFEISLAEGLLGTPMAALGYSTSSNSGSEVVKRWVEALRKEPLLLSRFHNYLNYGDGVESYPSDPTDPKNWGGDTGVVGQGAAAAYGRK